MDNVNKYTVVFFGRYPLSSDGIHENNNFLGTPGALLSALCPWVDKLCPGLTGFHRHQAFYCELGEEIQKMIRTHQDSLDRDNPEDLVDYFLINMENKKLIQDNFNYEEEMENLRALIIDILLVGEESPVFIFI